ncbi:hypothetical protein D9Q98_006899 [Chlorella vulgaris]|uniref:Intraflagellar transport 52-like protein n=1 Tax=Chlorella vulgaris TaxID=3077 RepID=A0A9D4TJ18_CHLVU|nr:hypothetical protein D9Q98_006899 [Chlorella vulgaris]
MDSSREGGSGPVILISSVKQECRSLRSGFKQLARHLKSARCDVRRLDATAGGGITPSSLAQAAIVVFGGPTEAFMPEELDCLRAYLRGGGNLLVLGAEGCGGQSGSHLNALLADFGIKVASDCVIQTAFTRYLHPKQVLVADGMLSPDMAAYCASNSKARRGGGGGASSRPVDENGRPLASFVYPHGATVAALGPALPILSSGLVAHPCNMTIGAAWWEDGGEAGRLAVLGSAAVFDDEWLGKEDNTALLDFLLGWMLRDPACALSRRNLAEPEILDPRPVTHVAELAAQPREHADLPRDLSKLFADSLFRLDMSMVPQVAALRRLRRRQLPLWTPPLEVPFPALQPAVFPPPFAELPPPPLELFDLEEELAGPLEQLNRLTAQFLAAVKQGTPGGGGSSQQLEAYIADCSQLLGLRTARGGTAKQQLAEVLEAVVQCKLPDYTAGGEAEEDF